MDRTDHGFIPLINNTNKNKFIDINTEIRKIKQKLLLCYLNYLAFCIASNISNFTDKEMLNERVMMMKEDFIAIYSADAVTSETSHYVQEIIKKLVVSLL